ncbi:Calcium influx-promoting protein ehs1 [Cytospora mali]|uniref:Calcium influx-promoting protein ehs1 n=1 Tax=Cytospora mali TaxID=578113 RepID=A0A194UYG6_CYTMA|nr:Calcium influx-promoting protein ehs1 [Valsa mali var. pyri (nom. inval.)]
MQLSLLQSRLVASAIATILLIILYLSLFPPQFAFAEELNHESPIIFDDATVVHTSDLELDANDGTYEPEFGAFDRSILGRVAKRDVISLTNNVPNQMNLISGTSLVYHFDSSQLSSRGDEESMPLELRGEPGESQGGEPDVFVDWDGEVKLSNRATTKTVYISANTCIQPSANSTTAGEPPQLTLYVSNSTKNTVPGPSADASEQEVRTFTEGAVMFNVTASSDVYLSVAANNVSSEFSGIYNFQIAASVDAWYHSYNESMADELFWVDSDTTSVLLITQNLTYSRSTEVEEGLISSRPYVMFAQNDNDTTINGMRYSYCGLNNYAQIAAVRNGQDTTQVTTGITRRGAGGYPKQQFYFSGLNASSKYQGILARNANATTNPNVPGGGGHVLRSTTFETKSTGANCNLVFNLTFCDEVAYAVPSNNITFPNTTLLGEFYDNYALSLYDGFNKSLAQIPCEAPDTQQFSLVRNCTTCQSAYKDWLCSVTIPRCEDFSSTDSWLQPRAINQTFPDGSTLDPDMLTQYSSYQDQLSFLKSRNPLIDSVVKPGPYKEVLPCAELCYDLVQSCPAALGFACPRPWLKGFNTSYGTKSLASDKGDITCNYPGSFHYYAGAAGLTVPWLLTIGVSMLAVVGVW